MKAPLDEFDADITGHIQPGIMQDMARVPLDLSDKPSKKNRVQGIDQVGADEHDVNEDIFLSLPAGISPGGAEKRYIRIGCHEPVNIRNSLLCKKAYGLKRLVQVQEEPFVAKFSKGIIKGQVSARRFVEQHP